MRDNRAMIRRRRAIVWLGCVLAVMPALADALAARDIDVAGARYRVVALDLARDALELHWRDADDQAFASIDGLRRWGEAQGRELRFAMNAGIYDRAFRPLGLHVEEGKVLRSLNTARGAPGAGNFSIQPNGVFYVDTDGKAGVMSTSAWGSAHVKARIASQSGPMLVVEGQINRTFDEDSDSLKWRSGVCAPDAGHVTFAVSEAPVSFHAFARVFRDTLGCRDALYLDGTLSRIWTSAEGYAGAPAMMVKPYAGMFAVFAAQTAVR